MHKATLYAGARPVGVECCVQAGAAVAHHHPGCGEALEERSPGSLRLARAPLGGDDFAAAAGNEDAPPGSEVEPVDLEHIVDLTGDLDAGAEFPAPLGPPAE